MTPEFLSLSGLFLKADPAEESGKRVLYMVASNEATDLQGEKVLAQSLQDSAAHFLKYGNLDLDHRTMLPPRAPGENPYLWEIGRPVDVQFRANDTLVKAELYQGESEVAKNANMVWDSLTKISPAARWFPSVGGQILDRGTTLDPQTGDKVAVVKKVRWTNIGLSRTPVNQDVPPITTVPVAQFCKSWTGSGWACQAAVNQEYLGFRDELAKAISSGRVGARISALRSYSEGQLGLPRSRAVEWVERFLRDLQAKRG